MRVAVIGAGSMGRNHARVYADMAGVTLVGVADSDATTAEQVARRCGTQPYLNFRQLLDEQRPNAISIAVPTIDHLDVALTAIERNIHVLIEKPIAATIEEGRTIIAAAQQQGVTLMIGHVERFNPAVVALKDHLASGELGRVFQIDARRQGPFPARVKDIGVVIDLAVHDLDLMRYVTGAEIQRVYAEAQRRVHSSREDLVSALLRLDDGSVGTVAVNWLTPTKIRELYVTGQRGMFRVDYLTQDLFFFENSLAQSPDWDTLQVLRGVGEGRMIRHLVAKREPLVIELEAFIAAARGLAAPAVSGEDGLRALTVAQAVVNSALEQRVVVL